jgi:hypothetical protein
VAGVPPCHWAVATVTKLGVMGLSGGREGADHRRVVMWWGGEAAGAPPWPQAVGGTGGGRLLMKEDEAELRAGEGGDGGSGRTHGAHV